MDDSNSYYKRIFEQSEEIRIALGCATIDEALAKLQQEEENDLQNNNQKGGTM